ncbi:hypothetical protein [Actinopolyspora xinjiangensis]|nr:hypothetical protein [Actinopolyspora xinjiangensis]
MQLVETMKPLLRKKGVATLIGIALSVTLLLPVANAAQAPHPSVANASSQEIIQGVFFGVGPVADPAKVEVQLPEDLNRDKYNQQIKTFLAELRTDDPAKFDSVADGLTSGSAPRVEEALNNGGKWFSTAAGSQAQQTTDVRPRCGAVWVCVAAAAAVSWVGVQNAVAATSVAGLTQAVVAWNGMYMPSSSSSTASTVERDRAIRVITENLAR